MAENSGMRILIADDEKEIRESLREIIDEEGHETVEADSESGILSRAAAGIDLAILDVKLGSDNGIDALKKLRTDYPQLPVIMITGFGTVSLAKEAFKLGAHDFLEKPLRLVQVRTCVRNALEGIRLRRRVRQHELAGGVAPIYCSPTMNTLFGQASRLAQIREPVVILGPSGSGKEVLAGFLHNRGPRCGAPFVATNAASMPVTLAEDELFGHERGAFTGADKQRPGCFERAHRGTLFLDEIAEMGLQIQAKLLRVLESGEVCRLGGSDPVKVDVKLVCATHKNPRELIAQGRFRHDLWYRISAFVLHVPDLQSRPEDIPLLAAHFLEQMNFQLGVNRHFSPQALEYIGRLTFPGNVRELKHLVARVAVYTDTALIEPADVAMHATQQNPAATQERNVGESPYAGLEYRSAREAFEKDYFTTALKRSGGHITATARKIGMAQSNLSRKLRELGLS